MLAGFSTNGQSYCCPVPRLGSWTVDFFNLDRIYQLDNEVSFENLGMARLSLCLSSSAQSEVSVKNWQPLHVILKLTVTRLGPDYRPSASKRHSGKFFWGHLIFFDTISVCQACGLDWYFRAIFLWITKQQSGSGSSDRSDAQLRLGWFAQEWSWLRTLWLSLVSRLNNSAFQRLASGNQRNQKFQPKQVGA